MKTDRQIKTEATKAEHKRVFENMNPPARDITAECSDGTWVREAWNGLNSFGWGRWSRV